MPILSDSYTDFFRIDLDARGGYARVADVLPRQREGGLVRRAFKLMRHELVDPRVGIRRFENEIKILSKISRDTGAPAAITRIYDSGFAHVNLSEALSKLREGDKASPVAEIISTGIELQDFIEMKNELTQRAPGQWVPYIVMDLAPFEDSLLRQIKPKSEEERANLYRLPVDSIVEMSIRLLDVLAYLHDNLHYAYLDWKPEHIYWNSANKSLKLIDWNVNSVLDDRTTNQLVREDLRMFCGAALYCGLALTDPEDPDKTIGPVPDLPKELMPVIRPRYWTDNPYFYQRETILDDRIKLLVKVGLNPREGFNSTTEFKRALTRFVAQKTDSLSSLPKDAVQHYKRARSYIAANDLSLAIISLELAIESAKAAGITFSDAENLLINIRDQLKADKLKKSAIFALELRQWTYVIDLYQRAIALDPENETMKAELRGLQDLLDSETELRRKGKFDFITNPFRLKKILDSTKGLVGLDNPTYEFVRRKYARARSVQFGTFIVVFMTIIFSLASFVRNGLMSIAQDTPTAVFTPPPSISATPEGVVTETVINTITITSTATTIEETLSPTPPAITATVVQGYGILTVAFFYPVDAPNGRRIDPALQGEQFLTIVGSQVDREDLWYKCTWEVNGVPGEGWILAKFIQFTPALSPTP